MRRSFALLSGFVFVFSLFTSALVAQKAPEQKVVSGIVSGTVLLKDKSAPDHKALLTALKSNWKLKTDSISNFDKTLVFSTSFGATVMIAYLDYPAAPDEVGAASRLSWLWKTAHEETMGHQAQIVISVIGPANRTLELYKIFTQTAAAVLETTNSPGVFLQSQYLVLSSGYFIAAARNMVQNQSIPLYCWVYFGRPGEGNGFTYGMVEFGFPEMEIVQANQSEGEVHSLLYDAAMSVVKYNTRLEDGQTLTTEDGASFIVKQGPGTFLEGQKVLRLNY